MTTTDETLTPRQRYQREVASISFLELQKHFAKGILIEVSSKLNLIDVAMAMHEDDAEQIERWMEQQKLVRAHDEHARKWYSEQTDLMAVTVAPWVLVQEPIRS
jgi:hypothetical protein